MKNLRGADLRGANLNGADLSGANLENANLEDADLSGANLENANLRGANLRGANLRGSNLRGANLRGANLRGANLRGANLLNAKLGDIIIERFAHSERNRYTQLVICKGEIEIQCGCFLGSLERFKKQVGKKDAADKRRIRYEEIIEKAVQLEKSRTSKQINI